MNLRHRNSHRAQEEGQERQSPPNEQEPLGGLSGQSPGPDNFQKLKKELWTRMIRCGDEHLCEISLHPILPDMEAFHESPPDNVTVGKKPWALLFDPVACNAKFAEKTEAQMVLKEAKLEQLALRITELREGLRGGAGLPWLPPSLTSSSSSRRRSWCGSKPRSPASTTRSRPRGKKTGRNRRCPRKAVIRSLYREGHRQ